MTNDELTRAEQLARKFGSANCWTGESGALASCALAFAGCAVGPDFERPAPPGVQRAIDRILALLAGAKDDLADLPLDFAAASPFQREVWTALLTIPWGEVVSYLQVAQWTGRGLPAARAVGRGGRHLDGDGRGADR